MNSSERELGELRGLDARTGRAPSQRGRAAHGDADARDEHHEQQRRRSRAQSGQGDRRQHAVVDARRDDQGDDARGRAQMTWRLKNNHDEP